MDNSAMRSWRHDFIWLVITSLLVLGLSHIAYAQYTEIGVVDIYGQSPNLVKLTDLDGDPYPEVIAIQGTDHLRIYSGKNGLTLFSWNVDSLFQSAGVSDFSYNFESIDALVGDMDHNGSRDLIIRAKPYYARAYDSLRYLLGFFGGALDQPDGHQLDSWDGKLSPYWPGELMTALDLNGDGYRELILSFDWFQSCSTTGQLCRHTSGQTICYNSYPDTEAWNYPRLLANLLPYTTDLGKPQFVVTDEYVQIVGGPYPAKETYRLTDRIALLDANGTAIRVETKITPDLCTGTAWDVYADELKVHCVGDIDADKGSIEVLCSYKFSQACSSDFPLTQFDTLGNKLILYRITASNHLIPLWSVNLPPDFSRRTFIFNPDIPGRFFGITNYNYGALVNLEEMNGATGQHIGTYQQLPTGVRKYWCEASDVFGTISNDPPFLVNQTDSGLSILRFNTVTDVDDGADNATLPETFTLGQPYPNPFNPTVTVPISINHKGHLRVELFNPLGQRVAVIHDAIVSAGELALEWDATDFASGVYLFKSTFGGETKSVKAVLLK